MATTYLVAASGGDYTTLDAAIDDLPVLNVSDDIIIELNGGETHSVSGIESWTNGSNNLSLTIRSETGASHNGDLSLGTGDGVAILQWSAAGSKRLDFDVPVVFQDLHIDFNGQGTNSASDGLFTIDQGTDTFRFERCIMRGGDTGTRVSTGYLLIKNTGAGDVSFYSCLLIDGTSSATSGGNGFVSMFTNVNDHDLSLFNCTCHDFQQTGGGTSRAFGLRSAGTGVTNSITNCICSNIVGGAGDAYEDGGITWTDSNALADDSTGDLGPETDTTTFEDPNNATITSRDYNLKTGSIAIQGGTHQYASEAGTVNSQTGSGPDYTLTMAGAPSASVLTTWAVVDSSGDTYPIVRISGTSVVVRDAYGNGTPATGAATLEAHVELKALDSPWDTENNMRATSGDWDLGCYGAGFIPTPDPNPPQASLMFAPNRLGVYLRY